MKRFLLTPALAGLVFATLLGGCASPPDRYFTLAATVAPGATHPARTTPGGVPMFIELAPVAMPDRLARPQMVVRRASAAGGAGAEVELLEQHRWASSFESEMRDALATGIAARLGAVDLTKGGRQPAQPAWRIAVQLQNFDAVENSRVDATFTWTARRADGERGATCQWTGTEPAGGGIDALAQGAQRVTARAAEAIAANVGRLASGGTAATCS